MARIPEYDAPDRTLTASDKGASAFEQAGRRIGPAYNEAATLMRQAGEAKAATIRQRSWPFDMLELERSLEEPDKNGSSKSGGGFKLAGGMNNLYNEGEGGGGGSTRASSRSRLGNDVGATSMAAGALGKLASRMGATGQYHNSLIDPETGIDMNLMKPQKTMQLVNGELVPATAKGSLAAGRLDINGENNANGYFKDKAAGLYDDPRKAKQFQDKYGYDPNTDRMNDSLVPAAPNWSDRGGGDFGNAYSPSPPDDAMISPGTVSARGATPADDFWSDITNGLGGVLKAGTTGEWPGGGDGSGGALPDLTGEGAQ